MEAPAGAPAIALRDVRKVYGEGEGSVVALDGISIGFSRGSFTAIMGPSGSGKSTLLHVAAGLDRPTSGTVALGDTELTGLSERRLTILRRERIGFVFQAFNLIPSLTVTQNIGLPLRLDGRRPRRSEVREVAARVGLDQRLRHRPAQLSGGQQQRVAIARALITRPEVVFADEPTGALDTRTGRGVLALLREVVDADGHTVVMVTHDPVAAAHADQVILLADGRIAGRPFESALRTQPPVERYAAAAAVVTGQQVVETDDDVVLGERARVDYALAARLAAVPGVRAAIADVSAPARLGGRPTVAHGWSSAALTPYVLSAGRSPAGPGEVATGYPAALGKKLRLASTEAVRAVTVVGVARPRHPVRRQAAIFLTDGEAARLAGHPGRLDAIGVLAAPGFDASRLRAAGGGAEVLTGDARGRAEYPELLQTRTELIAVAAAFGGLALFIAIFVVASTGDLDTNTPIEASRQAAAQFAHPIYGTVANAGHTPDLQPCGVTMAIDFIKHLKTDNGNRPS